MYYYITNKMATTNDILFKSGASALIAFGLNKFVLKEENTKTNGIFALSVGVGVGIGAGMGKMIPVSLTSSLPNGKGLGQRATEIVLGGASTYIANTYVLKNMTYGETLVQKLGVILVADLAGEYVADYLAGRPLAIFE
jgi:hypothetical protein